MRTLDRVGLVFCVLILSASPAGAADPAPTDVTLTRRVDRVYGTSAYSFRLASQDQAVHRNYVDLVFNNCGQLHINPVGGMSSRIVDLGAVPFGSAVAVPTANAAWHHESITPQAGHVYFQDIKDENQNFAVEFIVTEAGPNTVKLRWRTVDPAHLVLPLAAGRGAAGTMGKCGGLHPEE